MKRRQIALPPQMDDYVEMVAKEWGVQASEVVRNALAEWRDRREKMVPRPGKHHPKRQMRMPLGSDETHAA